MMNFIYICCQVARLLVDETEQAIMAAILAAILYFSKQPGFNYIFNSNVPSNRINIKKLTIHI